MDEKGRVGQAAELHEASLPLGVRGWFQEVWNLDFRGGGSRASTPGSHPKGGFLKAQDPCINHFPVLSSLRIPTPFMEGKAPVSVGPFSAETPSQSLQVKPWCDFLSY
jgi:hypothetical protein